MDNKEFLEKLKFGSGDGNIQYYIYNWACPMIPAEKVCFTFAMFIYRFMFFRLGCIGTSIIETHTLIFRLFLAVFLISKKPRYTEESESAEMKNKD